MRLVLLGDVMLGRLVNDLLKSRPPEYPWGDTLPLLRSAQWRMCNLECVISAKGSPWAATPKAFHFRSDPKNVRVLQSATIDCVSLANNHVLDFGYDALLEMLDLLKAAGIAHAGAGRNRTEAVAPAISKVGEAAIAVIAFTDNEPQWEAGAQRAGVFYVPADRRDGRTTALLAQVRNARRQANLVVVSAHWGGNWGYYPPAAHKRLARSLIEAGADIVFGHSAHVFRGVEIYRGKPIFYGAGDFIDDYAVNPDERNDESFVFVVRSDGLAVRELLLHPVQIRHMQARLASAQHARIIASKMKGLCGALGTIALWNETQRRLEIRTG